MKFGVLSIFQNYRDEQDDAEILSVRRIMRA
jgi:hypothetical protein